MDAVREQITREYDTVLGSMGIEPLRTLRIQRDQEKEDARGKKWAPVIQAVGDKLQNLSAQHAVWMGQQLTAEVLRFQIQQEAIRDAYKGRDLTRNVPPMPSSNSHMSLVPYGAHEISVVDIHFKHVITSDIPC